MHACTHTSVSVQWLDIFFCDLLCVGILVLFTLLDFGLFGESFSAFSSMIILYSKTFDFLLTGLASDALQHLGPHKTLKLRSLYFLFIFSWSHFYFKTCFKWFHFPFYEAFSYPIEVEPIALCAPKIFFLFKFNSLFFLLVIILLI